MGMEQGEYIDGNGGADFTYGYGAGGDEYAVDYASVYGGTPDYAPGYEPGGSDLFNTYLDYYLNAGLDPITAQAWAAEDAQGPAFQLEGEGQAPAPTFPDFTFPFYELPYIPEPFLTPYTPTFPEYGLPPPPDESLPPSPVTQQPNLPPACPGGQYHPYPIGHPQQNICIPFPVSQTPSPTQQPKSGQPPSPIQQAPKPPAQQQQQKCPTGQYRDPVTGQCKPIPQGQPQACPTGYYRASNGQCLPIPKCTTPGTVFDQARGLCVPAGQAISPLPEGVEGLFDELKKLPWWIWLALGGLILLSRDGEGGRKTTVTYRRAS